MSDPRWRDQRPSRSYAGESGGRPPGRDTRGLDPRQAGDGRRPEDKAGTRRLPAQTDLTGPIDPQSRAAPARRASRRAANGAGRRNGARRGNGAARAGGRGAASRPRGSGGRLSRIWEGSLRGALAVCVIGCSALIGTVASIVTHSQPGSVLGLFVLAGTVAAALTVQPRTGRLLFPVPALSYLIGALATGVAYDRSTDKTELAVGAAQWIASGFFVMVLATLLAVALTTVRWFMWRRDQRRPQPPDWPVPPGPADGPRPSGTQPAQWPPRPQGSWDQRLGPAPDQRPQPGSGPYNFSSGA